MTQMSVQEWRVFLKARILQEQGNDQEALKVFDELLALHSNNPHVMSARAFALQRLGRKDEALASRIAAQYGALARSLSGPADEPEPWITGLRSAIVEIDQFEASGSLSPTLVAW